MKFNDKVYYETENDELSDFSIKPRKIDKNYSYLGKNAFTRFFGNLSFYLFAVPLAFFYVRIIKRIKFENAQILKKVKKQGYFIYANHTNQWSDAFSIPLLNFPKRVFLITNADNVSQKVMGNMIKFWGPLPLPETKESLKNFNLTLEKLIKKHPIIIYPEARLWQYYTKIRNFDEKSFRYAVKYGTPIVSCTTTYTCKKQGKKPKITLTFDGPFYLKQDADKKENENYLREKVYNSLCKNSLKSDYEFIRYEKRT